MITPTSSTSRRSFLHSSVAVGAALVSGLHQALARGNPAQTQAPASGPLRILVLGGSSFLGPAFIELARAHGHSITVFNRGITEKRKGSLGDGIERLVGDRDPEKGAGLGAIEEQIEAGKTWDVVLDTSGFYPRIVKASAELLAPVAGRYVFVSSISAYAKSDRPGADETAELATVADPSIETMGEQAQNYGGFKVMCEQAAEAAMPGKTCIVRPGFVVGPGDGSDRFTYWPWRVQQGGEMAVPGAPENPMQIIDVRDLAAFMLRCAEKGTNGVFNVCGLEKPVPMGEIITTSQRVVKAMGGKPAEPVWISQDFLATYPASLDFTTWIADSGETAGFHRVSNARAVAAGLTFTPLATTIKDTLEWFPAEQERRVRVSKEMVEEARAKGEPAPRIPENPGEIRAGLEPAQEAALLAAWKEREKAD